MKKGHNKRKNKRKKAQKHQKLMEKHARKAKYDRAEAEHKLEVARRIEVDKTNQGYKITKAIDGWWLSENNRAIGGPFLTQEEAQEALDKKETNE